ncbi:Flp family type IVb pilin [Sphingosinicella ginsenosidimutans]|uniref:Flp family type IVb pilin n=1 Tax=Allosphingosinicella ginsenosidimutans TaxID=1176539 RepID=A0A5C6TWH9_9SPHN|nr:Flp family type IVb pilin [Sphingosinicella ginsenosidimutans]TXC64261.1 Flp family type IVb pilin [Sphingosinicella ginsenosidimutans]
MWEPHGLFRDEKGATAIEYGLIIAMVVLAMFGALSQLAGVTTGMWNNVSSEVIDHT